MTLRTAAAALLADAILASCSAPPPGDRVVTRIGFGSCYRQDGEQDIWESVLRARPEVFLMLGDNVYADTENMDTLRAAYARLAAAPGFAVLRDSAIVLATWDDHDYGADDTGNWYPMRDSSERVFERFWGLPEDDPARARPGVYQAHTFGPEGRRVQIILLDTRYFRDPFGSAERDPGEAELGFGPYGSVSDMDATMLGEAQWDWLEARLREPADVRLIGSSIQVVSGEHGWESWQHMPHERARFYRLIEATRASGVIFLTGDVHWAEISADLGGPYTLYDATSSALNQSWPRAMNLPNRYRVSETPYPYPNFGMISIDWEQRVVTLKVLDEMGWSVFGHGVRLETLRAR